MGKITIRNMIGGYEYGGEREKKRMNMAGELEMWDSWCKKIKMIGILIIQKIWE